MIIPTEPIGSIPRPPELVRAIAAADGLDARLEELFEDAALRYAHRPLKHIPIDQLGTTDDCGFSPFCDDTSTSRDLAFAKIRGRVLGTAFASKMLGVG